jgi:hypothetical protein
MGHFNRRPRCSRRQPQKNEKANGRYQLEEKFTARRLSLPIILTAWWMLANDLNKQRSPTWRSRKCMEEFCYPKTTTAYNGRRAKFLKKGLFGWSATPPTLLH